MTWVSDWGMANDEIEAIDYTWEQLCKPKDRRAPGTDALEAAFRSYVDRTYRASAVMRWLDPYDDPRADRMLAYDLFAEWLNDMDMQELEDTLSVAGWRHVRDRNPLTNPLTGRR